jgi:putative ABC transport system permease protein
MIRLAWKLAWRDLRGGFRALRGLRVVVACLALGVAAMAGVGSLRASIETSLAENGARLLGGDLVVQGGAQALPDALRDLLRQRGARISKLTSAPPSRKARTSPPRSQRSGRAFQTPPGASARLPTRRRRCGRFCKAPARS